MENHNQTPLEILKKQENFNKFNSKRNNENNYCEYEEYNNDKKDETGLANLIISIFAILSPFLGFNIIITLILSLTVFFDGMPKNKLATLYAELAIIIQMILIILNLVTMIWGINILQNIILQDINTTINTTSPW